MSIDCKAVKVPVLMPSLCLDSCVAWRVTVQTFQRVAKKEPGADEKSNSLEFHVLSGLILTGHS